KCEVELVWNGKSREVGTTALPVPVAGARGRAAPGGAGIAATVAVKVIDIFGSDTMVLVPVSVG
ncbi:MAG: hypothetical protein MUF80_10820, partial [Burkholderiales bacterium]|nr:hypothetical protein [Burkholderiales bacterium]